LILGLSIPAYLHVDYRECIRERKILAQGGFGVVILAEALDHGLKQFGDLLIVKKLKKPQLSDRDSQLFYQEISLMEYFKNEKYVAKLLGYSTDPFCLIMKYYEMGSLSQFIKTATYRSKLHVISFCKDIASGLQAMHLKGVVHNDLKPDNILLDMHNGQTFCVLSDLGISQVITPQILKVGQFQVAQIKGLSLVYAAPERIAIFRNKYSLNPALAERQVIFSWDLYSLGVIMFELLTAQTKLFKLNAQKNTATIHG
jgi:eukaryotic-like serine/threonine-protein kinase